MIIDIILENHLVYVLLGPMQTRAWPKKFFVSVRMVVHAYETNTIIVVLLLC